MIDLRKLAAKAGRPDELRHALRVSIAVVAAYAAAKLLALPQGYWAVITALLVVQTSVGGSLKAALDRLLGTVAGAFYGAAVVFFIPHGTDLELGIAIVAAILPLAYLAAINAAFRVAPVTAIIVLLPISGHPVSPWVSALDRVFEIIIGNIAALAVTFLILPPRAHAQLREAAARVVRLNADLLNALVDSLLGDKGRQGVQPIHAKIRAALKKAETIAEEAARERKMRVAENRDPEPVVRNLYRVRHDLVMVGRAAVRPLPADFKPRLGPPLAILRDDLDGFLRSVSKALVDHTMSPSLDRVTASIKGFSAELEACGAELPRDEAGRLFTLRFAIEQLGEDLRDLAARTNEMAAAQAGGPVS